MTTPRPTNWDPLADRDPVPGDPLEVLRLAVRYRDTANLLRDQAAKLRSLAADQGMSSDAWHAFQEQAPGVADHLEQALRRFDETAAALNTYGKVLDEAQAAADQALADAKVAQTGLDAANRGLTDAQDALDADRRASALAGIPGSPESALVRAAQLSLDDAQARLARARAALQEAVDLRDRAARTASNAIHDVATHDGLRDSRWDRLKHAWDGVKKWVGDRADVIAFVSDWAGMIATGLGIAALAVGWIPVIGQAAAAVLGAGALAFTAVALVGHLTLAATGHGNWLDVGLDAVALATFGIGRAFSVGAKASYVAARAEARTTAYAVVRSGAPNLSRSATYARVNAMAGGKAGAAIARPATIARAGVSPVPKLGTIVESLKPQVIAHETAEAWRGTEEAWRSAAGVRGMAPNMDLASELGRLSRVDAALKTGSEFVRLEGLGNAQRLGWGVTTSSAVSLDLTDKAGVFDRMKSQTVWAP